MVTISLCMIVRDEAEELSLLLPAIQDELDQIVAVDTGSVDPPRVEVARSHLGEARNLGHPVDSAILDRIRELIPA